MDETAIVILGAANDDQGGLSSVANERCHQALSLFRQHAAARIIPTGGWGAHFNTTAQPHARYLRDHLIAQGVPATAFVECVESSNTLEDARLCRPVVERHGFRRLLVVTSDFHLARARYVFETEFKDVALEFSGSETHLPPDELNKKIAHERQALAKLKQSAGLKTT